MTAPKSSASGGPRLTRATAQQDAGAWPPTLFRVPRIDVGASRTTAPPIATESATPAPAPPATAPPTESAPATTAPGASPRRDGAPEATAPPSVENRAPAARGPAPAEQTAAEQHTAAGADARNPAPIRFSSPDSPPEPSATPSEPVSPVSDDSVPPARTWMEVAGSRLILLLLLAALVAVAVFANREGPSQPLRIAGLSGETSSGSASRPEERQAASEAPPNRSRAALSALQQQFARPAATASNYAASEATDAAASGMSPAGEASEKVAMAPPKVAEKSANREAPRSETTVDAADPTLSLPPAVADESPATVSDATDDSAPADQPRTADRQATAVAQPAGLGDDAAGIEGEENSTTLANGDRQASLLREPEADQAAEEEIAATASRSAGPLLEPADGALTQNAGRDEASGGYEWQSGWQDVPVEYPATEQPHGIVDWKEYLPVGSSAGEPSSSRTEPAYPNVNRSPTEVSAASMGRPGQYGAPQYGAPESATPGYGAPTYGASEYGAPAYGTPSAESFANEGAGWFEDPRYPSGAGQHPSGAGQPQPSWGAPSEPSSDWPTSGGQAAAEYQPPSGGAGTYYPAPGTLGYPASGATMPAPHATTPAAPSSAGWGEHGGATPMVPTAPAPTEPPKRRWFGWLFGS